MYEVGLLRLKDLKAMLQCNGYATFRRFNGMPGSLTLHMQCGNKTREEALNDIWRHYGRPMIVAVNLMIL